LKGDVLKMKNINEKEEMKSEKITKAQAGLIVIVSVGVATGMYGLVKGYQIGHRIGVRDGILDAQKQFLEATKHIAAEAVRKYEGE
jgi:hypothetical protein